MTKSLSVLNNIDLIGKQLENFNKQKEEIDKEILRLEGSLRVFKQLKDVGLETIDIPEDIVENTEVIDNDTIQNSCPGTDN
jgi:hypothetical protein